MSNQWFRMYHEFATDPKVQVLTEALQRRYVMVLCLHCNNGFYGVPDDEIALALRITEQDWLDTKAALIKRGLLDENGAVHGWDNRQYISDIKDPTAAERQRRYRDKLRDESVTHRNATVTSRPPESDTDTDTDIVLAKAKTCNTVTQKPVSILTECLSAETAEDLIAHRKAKKSPLTAGSAKGLVKQFLEYGDPEAAAQAMMANGWTGFKADWMRSDARAGPNKPEKMSAITKALLNLESSYGNETQANGSPAVVYEVPRLVGVG